MHVETEKPEEDIHHPSRTWQHALQEQILWKATLRPKCKKWSVLRSCVWRQSDRPLRTCQGDCVIGENHKDHFHWTEFDNDNLLSRTGGRAWFAKNFIVESSSAGRGKTSARRNFIQFESIIRLRNAVLWFGEQIFLPHLLGIKAKGAFICCWFYHSAKSHSHPFHRRTYLWILSAWLCPSPNSFQYAIVDPSSIAQGLGRARWVQAGLRSWWKIWACNFPLYIHRKLTNRPLEPLRHHPLFLPTLSEIVRIPSDLLDLPLIVQWDIELLVLASLFSFGPHASHTWLVHN